MKILASEQPPALRTDIEAGTQYQPFMHDEKENDGAIKDEITVLPSVIHKGANIKGRSTRGL